MQDEWKIKRSKDMWSSSMLDMLQVHTHPSYALKSWFTNIFLCFCFVVDYRFKILIINYPTFMSKIIHLISKYLKIEEEKITYSTGQAGPWTRVKCITCCLYSNINVFFGSFTNPCYNLSCSWIYCFKCLTCFLKFSPTNKST